MKNKRPMETTAYFLFLNQIHKITQVKTHANIKRNKNLWRNINFTEKLLSSHYKIVYNQAQILSMINIIAQQSNNS